jgi:hypothetical protein
MGLQGDPWCVESKRRVTERRGKERDERRGEGRRGKETRGMKGEGREEERREAKVRREEWWGRLAGRKAVARKGWNKSNELVIPKFDKKYQSKILGIIGEQKVAYKRVIDTTIGW